MAKSGTSFKKGHTLSKEHGRPASTPLERKLVKLSKTAFKSILADHLSKSPNEIKKALKIENQDKLSALEVMTLQCVSDAMHMGDPVRIQWFMEQLFGKANPKLEIITANDEKPLDISKLSIEELKLLKALTLKAKNDIPQIE